MNTRTRLAAFGLAAGAALGGGAVLGAATGPAPAASRTTHADHEESSMPSADLAPTDHAEHPGRTAAGSAFRLAAATTVVEPGIPQPFTFTVLDPTGAAVTRFEDRHERPMHLILVSNDLTGYAHLHPRLADDGTWTAELPALAPGGHRVIADTAPVGGPELVLTVDLVVPGAAPGRALPDPSDRAAVDGLDVTLDLAASAQGPTAALTVRRDGAVVEPDPYLGARGHLVAIAADDLGYLHVHPADGTGAVSFAIADPAPGRYRLFFDFSVDGQVHTAAFTVDITAELSEAAGGHTHDDGAGHP